MSGFSTRNIIDPDLSNNMNNDDIFLEETQWSIREHILKYNLTINMSDVERAKFLGLDDSCRMRENAKILLPEKLRCGVYVHIGEGVILDASGGLDIGDHTSLGPYVMVWTHSSHLLNLTGNNVRGGGGIIRKSTKIGSNCFIGTHTVIMPGVTVGDNVVIQPLSIVDQDVPNNKVYGSHNENKKLRRKVAKLEDRIQKLELSLSSNE